MSTYYILVHNYAIISKQFSKLKIILYVYHDSQGHGNYHKYRPVSRLDQITISVTLQSELPSDKLIILSSPGLGN